MEIVPGLMRITVLLGLALSPTAAQMFHQPERAEAAAFPVMAWGGAPSDLAQLRDMREAGLNVAGFCRPEDIAKVRQAGLACFVRDPRVNGYDWKALPPDAELRRRVAEAVREAGDSAAVLGYYLIDEPHSDLMPGLGRVARLVRELAPGKLPYVNLFPIVVGLPRIGTPDYETYVRMLVDTVGQPFLSYDNYGLFEGRMQDQFYNNLEVVRRIGIEKGTPFWNCVLANAHFNYLEPTDATLHLQVYGTLAYGGRGIQYFTYYTPHVGNYRLGALDQFGNKTPTWEMLRRVNLELHALIPTMLKLRSTGVFHHPDIPPLGKPLTESRLVEKIEISRAERSRYLVGEFEDNQGRPYVMLVNKDLTQSFRFALEPRAKGRKLIRICNYSGREETFGGEMNWVAPGAGVLLRIE